MLGAITSLSAGDDEEEELKITEPQFQTNTDFLAHFIYAFLYENSSMLFVVLTTKCCANRYIKKDTIYYKFCLVKLGFRGFTEPNWFCKLFPCRVCKTINSKNRRSIDERSNLSSDGPKGKVSYSADKQHKGVLSPKKRNPITNNAMNANNKDSGGDTPESDTDDDMKDITLVLSEVDENITENNDNNNNNNT